MDGRSAGDDRDRHSGCIVCDARDAALPGEADAARQRRREVVRMPLEVDPEGEQLFGICLSTCRCRAGNEAERDRRRARPEPAGTGNAFGEREAEAFGRSKSRECTHGEMVWLGFAAAFDELELVPEIECGAGAVEACA